MKCTCGTNVVVLERKLKCPDCGAALVLPGSGETECVVAILKQQLSAAQSEVVILRNAYEATDALLNSPGVSGACLLAANHGYTVTPEQQTLIDRVTRAKEVLKVELDRQVTHA